MMDMRCSAAAASLSRRDELARDGAAGSAAAASRQCYPHAPGRGTGPVVALEHALGLPEPTKLHREILFVCQ